MPIISAKEQGLEPYDDTAGNIGQLLGALIGAGAKYKKYKQKQEFDKPARVALQQAISGGTAKIKRDDSGNYSYETGDDEDSITRQLIDAASGGKFPSGVKSITRKGVTLQNPDYVPPLNPLQQAQLDKERKSIEQAEDAQKEREDILREESEDIAKTITAVKSGSKYFGFAGNLPTAAVPSTLAEGYGPRREWEANVDKLLSGKVIEVMTNMKKASKTGATGFGQLSNKELALLKEASTALKKDLDPETALKYLNDMERINNKVLNKRGADVNSFSSVEEAEAANLPSGTIVMIGNRKARID